MKVTDAERELFNKWFKIHSDHLKMDLIEWQESQLQIMDEFNFSTKIDFKDFALQSVLHRVKSWHDTNHNGRLLMNDINEILNNNELP